jgi:hypothetical protein
MMSSRPSEVSPPRVVDDVEVSLSVTRPSLSVVT